MNSTFASWLADYEAIIAGANFEERIPTPVLSVNDSGLALQLFWPGTEVKPNPPLSFGDVRSYVAQRNGHDSLGHQEVSRLLRCGMRHKMTPDGVISVNRSQAAELLLEASRCSLARFSDGEALHDLVVTEARPIELGWRLDLNNIRMGHALSDTGWTYRDAEQLLHLATSGVVTPLTLPDGVSVDQACHLLAMPAFPHRDAESVFTDLLNAHPDFPVEPNEGLVNVVRVPPRHPRPQLTIKKRGKGLIATAGFCYFGHTYLTKDTDRSIALQRDSKSVLVTRHPQFEEYAFQLLEFAGLTRVPNSDDYEFVPDVGDVPHGSLVMLHFWANFLDNEIPRLEQKGWRVKLPRSPLLSEVDCPTIEGRLADDDLAEDKYRISLGIEIDGKRVSLVSLVLSLLRGVGGDISDWDDLSQFVESGAEFGYLPLEDGTIVRLPAERLRTLLLMVIDNLRTISEDEDCLRLDVSDVAYSNTLAESFENDIQWQGTGQIGRLHSVLSQQSKPPSVPIPAAIRATLKPHQKDGVDLITFLAEQGFSILLCDEMGTGKTLQMLTAYAVQREIHPTCGPMLVVAPNNGIDQWTGQTESHAPGLRVARAADEDGSALPAPERDAIHQACAEGKIDVLVCSYHTAMNDIETLNTLGFHFAVLDEAQEVRNWRANKTEALKTLSAKFVYPCTGTPIQNGLTDYFSLVSLALPGYLGSDKAFRKRFVKPIEHEEDTAKLALLKGLTAPFVRRKRREDKDVDSDVPTPIFKDIEVELGLRQRDLYESIRVTTEAEVRQHLREKGLRGQRRWVLTQIGDMNKCVCDPRLIDKRFLAHESAKTQALRTLLLKFREEGTPALVFSRYKILMPYFTALADDCSVTHDQIHSDVKNRGSITKGFQAGKFQTLFATLGTMNSAADLFAARAVVIYDSWWNPAVELQAIGRMVRQGQTEQTTVYRLRAPFTLDEHLVYTQRRKLALVDAVFGSDIRALSQEMVAEDIDRLFISKCSAF